MDRKTLFVSLSLLGVATIGLSAISVLNDSFDGISLVNRINASNGYTLTLDSSNHLDTEDGGLSYFSYTAQPLRNKVYFDFDDTAVLNSEDGWIELESGGDLGFNPSVYNTRMIKGMSSIQIKSDSEHEYIKLHYGSEIDGEITYSNFVEFNTSTINYPFPNGYRPSYIKIEGRSSGEGHLLESVIISYSCEEGSIIPTENLSYELIEGKQEYRILGFTDRDGDSRFIDDLVIPSSINDKPVTEIGDDAFNGPEYSTIYGFKSITIPDSVTYIGDRAFAYCPKVTKINMPSGDVTLGDDAFLYCGDMETINITKDQTEIDLAAYQASPVLTTINVEAGNSKYYSYNGMLFQYSYSDEHVSNKKTLLYCPCAKTGTITIPNDVEYIAETAFKNSKASTIHIGSNIANISEDFKSCNSLSSFEVEAGNTHYSAVESDNLPSVKMLCKNDVIVAYPRGNSGTSVTIPSTVDKVGDYVFNGVSKLENITVQGDVEIGEGAFSNMPNLESADISSVKVIGDGTFKNCSNLESVALYSNLLTIPNEAFMGCSSLTFDLHVLPSTIKTISSRAFKNCSSLSLDSLPNGLLSIGDEAFMNCTSLDINEMPDDVNTLGDGIFRNTAINSVVCASSLNYIPADMFRDCSSLTSITIPSHIRTIGLDAFRGCSNLSGVTILDNSVTTIRSRAFYECYISRIFIPKCVETIEGSAFAGGRSIVDIDTDVKSPEGQEYSSSSLGGGGWLNPGWSAAFGSGATIYRIHYSQSR